MGDIESGTHYVTVDDSEDARDLTADPTDPTDPTDLTKPIHKSANRTKSAKSANAGEVSIPTIIISFAFVLFSMVLFALLVSILIASYWCDYYSPYLRCDFLPFMTLHSVDVIGWVIVSLILILLIIVINLILLSVNTNSSRSSLFKIINFVISLVLFASCLCAVVCVLMESASTSTGIISAITVCTTVEFVLIIIGVIEFCIAIKKQR
jgi:hypothetical protein